MTVLFTNNAASNLASSITNTATSLTVTTSSGSIFPTPTGGDYFLVTLQGISGTPIEIVKCTSRSGDTMTIVRAQEGTTASAFSGGDKVELRITAGEMNAIETAINGINPVGTGAVYENSNTITANYTMTSSKNGVSAGPVTVATGITVTIPTGSRWVIV